MVDPNDIAYQYPQCAWAIGYLAEAASLSGRGAEALGPLRHIEEMAAGTIASGVVRALAYARAVLAAEDQAEACEQSLRRMGTDRIDLYLLHLGGLPIAQAQEAAGTLEDLVADGMIRSYGWSTDDPNPEANTSNRY